MKFFILFTVLASLFMASSVFGVPIIGDVGKTTVSKHAEPLQLCKNPHWCCKRENSKTAIGHAHTARPTKTAFELPQTFHVCCTITNGVWKCGETCDD